MGQAAQTVVTDVADYAIARKRNGKPLRGTGLYTGNIIVFSQLKELERSKVRVAGARARQAALKISDDVAPALNVQISASQAPTYRFSSAARLISSHTSIAAAILVVLATGAEVSSVWSSNEMNESVQSIADNEPLVIKPLGNELSENEPISESVALKPPTPDTTTTDPAVDELNASRKLAKEYKEKVEQVLALNTSLQEQIDALDKETIDLNKELLQLEWEVTALEAKPQKTAGARTVYNIVNIPVGDGTNPSDYNARPVGYSEQDYEQAYEQNKEQYYNYQLTQTASYVPDDFTASEEYYGPLDEEMEGDYEEFGKPYFN